MTTAKIIGLILSIILVCVFPPIGIVLLIVIIISMASGNKDDEFDIDPMSPAYRQIQREEEFELWKMKQEYLEKQRTTRKTTEKLNADLDEIEAELDARIEDPNHGIPGIRLLDQPKEP